MIQHVIFDLGNVMVNIHPRETMELFAKKCHLSEDQVASFYLSPIHLGFMAGKYKPQEFYRLMMERYPCDLSPEEYTGIWNRVIGEPKTGIREIIDDLKESYTLSVCSNTDPWHWNYCRQSYDFLSKFRHYFLSFEMGMNKPDPGVFKTVLTQLKAAGPECVFIDDTAENIETAKGFGIVGILSSQPVEIRQAMLNLNVL